MESDFNPQQNISTTNHLLESNISFEYDGTNSFRGNPNEYGGSSSFSGTGSTNRLGGTGSSVESQNGFGMNTFQSVPESPIHRSSSPTRIRETSSPTHAPFIPRSSTHRYLPNSPFKKAVETSSLNTDQLGEIIKEAIANAVDAAQAQWIKELKSGTFTHPDYAGSENFHHRFTQLASKVDILQDQV